MSDCIRNSKKIVDESRTALEGKFLVIVGAGGLGSTVAEILVRTGAEHLIIIDDDTVEESNLDRQTLYTHADIGRLKTEAATERLKAITPTSTIITHNTKLDAQNADELLTGADLVIDGLDNNEGRRCIAQWCAEHSTPWVHAAVIGYRGQVLSVKPEINISTLLDKERQECSEMGVLPTAVKMTAALQAQQGILTLQGNAGNKLMRINALDGSIEHFDVRAAKENAASTTSD